MIIATTAPTGNVGSKVASFLVNLKGIQVNLLTRSREKVRHLEEFGAIVNEGDLEDSRFVSRATAAADALFWITPTPPTTHDLRGFQNHLGENAAKAVVTNSISRVVNLSSVGAHIGHDTGPIDGLHDVEKHLDKVAESHGAKVTHLRPAFFMENYLLFAGPILEHGVVPLPVSGDRKIPMVATDDVAVESVRQLAFPGDGGRAVKPLHGPRDISFDEAAMILGEVLEKPVRHVRIEPDDLRDALTAQGISGEVASRLVAMYQAMEHGHLRPELKRTDASATPTDFRVFCEGVFAPGVSRAEGP